MSKITIERNVLLKTLGHVARVVEKRNTYPILANLCIDAGGNGVTIRATDLDIEVTDTIAAEVTAPFTTTVSAQILHDITRKIPDGSEIVIEQVDEGTSTLRSGRSRFNLSTLSAEGFPTIEAGGFSHSFAIDAADLRGMIAKTQFAISTEETRYYLNGIYLHAHEDGAEPSLRAVATDGHRMARTSVPLPEGAAGLPGVIVPRKTVGEISKLLDGVTGPVNIDVSSSKIRIVHGDVVLLSKLIEGEFPDYERVTPKNNDKLLTVNRTELSKALDRVSVVSNDRGGKAVKLVIGADELSLEVDGSEHGSATEALAANFNQEDSLAIGFSIRYLASILDVIESDDVEFAFLDAGSPSLVSAPTDTTTLYVLMPMRIN